ncbi:MAG: amidase, partial [Pseudomonadota bacterium]
MLDATKPLWQAGACDVAEAVGAGTLTCEAAVGAAVERMRAVNGHLNAVVEDLGDQALAEAAAADKALADGAPAGPLQGVPVTIKVNADQTGCATTHGVMAFKDNVAGADAPQVTALKEAGAIVIGRTNTPEFSFRATTVNDLHGRTFNPWNDELSPGGSSGGASSAVMAGMGAVAHGNDIGGSLRFPAWCTGAATVKPGLGRVAAWNPSQTEERGMLAQVMSVQGAICREVRDVRAAMQALIRPDPRDPWHVPMPWQGPALEKKVALTKAGHGFDVDPAVSAALDAAAGALSDAGYDVQEIEPPLLAECAAEAAKCLFGETIEMLGGDIEAHGSETIRAIFAEYARQFGVHRGRDLLAGYGKRSTYVRAWMQFLADWPLVLTPFMPTMPFTWDRDTEGEDG